jgi:hypothetical protein
MGDQSVRLTEGSPAAFALLVNPAFTTAAIRGVLLAKEPNNVEVALKENEIMGCIVSSYLPWSMHCATRSNHLHLAHVYLLKSLY